MSGTGFWVYRGEGALLEWALLNYFIDFHRKNNVERKNKTYNFNDKGTNKGLSKKMG